MIVSRDSEALSDDLSVPAEACSRARVTRTTHFNPRSTMFTSSSSAMPVSSLSLKKQNQTPAFHVAVVEASPSSPDSSPEALSVALPAPVLDYEGFLCKSPIPRSPFINQALRGSDCGG